MPTNTAIVTSLYQAIDYLAPDTADLNTYVTLLNTGLASAGQVATDIETSPFTMNVVDAVIREYQAAFGRVPDQGGAAYWVGTLAGPTGVLNTAAPNLTTLSTTFDNSAEFGARYGGATATTAANPALVSALYINVLNRAPDAPGLAYWVGTGLNAAGLLTAFASASDAEFVTNANAAIIAFQNLEVTGTEPTSGSLFALTNVVLTPQARTVNGAQMVTADLSPATLNGTGPTLVTGDNLSNIGTLAITDQYGQANDVMPAGVTLANIKFITLNTAGNAGVGVNGGGSGSGTGAYFDVSGVSGLQGVTVTSTGSNVDSVKAAGTANITITHNSFLGGVDTFGGQNIVIADYGTSAIPGFVDSVGSFVFPGANPTGTVNVTEFGSNTLVVAGGTAPAGSTAVNVTRYGAGSIQIGDPLISLVTPGTNVSSGNIVVTDNDNIQTATGSIGIFGGQNVTVNATPITGGNITVGTLTTTGAAPVSFNPTTGQQFVATGAVLVNDNVINAFQTIYRTGASFGQNANVTVVGGTTVGVTTNTGSVLVGAPAIVANGAASNLFNGTVPVLAPNGTSPLVSSTVTITDTAVSSAQFVNVAGLTIFTGDVGSRLAAAFAYPAGVAAFTTAYGAGGGVLAAAITAALALPPTPPVSRPSPQP